MRIGLIWKATATAAIVGGLLMGQAKQPQPKSQKEAEALQAIFSEPDPNKRIAAVDDLLTKFADTEYKAAVLQVAAGSAQQKGDFEKMIVYAERALEADPQSYPAMLMIANGLAQRTKEHDLDKEEKLGRAEKMANQALELIPKAVKPNPNITDEQWAGAQKEMAVQAHEALGISASVRKKYDVAITQFRAAVEGNPNADPSTYVRLADAYLLSNKPDDAISTVNKVYAMPDLNPAIKRVADSIKDKAQKVKAGDAKIGDPTKSSGPAQVEIGK